jgi:hypothetical protein
MAVPIVRDSRVLGRQVPVPDSTRRAVISLNRASSSIYRSDTYSASGVSRSRTPFSWSFITA